MYDFTTTEPHPKTLTDNHKTLEQNLRTLDQAYINGDLTGGEYRDARIDLLKAESKKADAATEPPSDAATDALGELWSYLEENTAGDLHPAIEKVLTGLDNASLSDTLIKAQFDKAEAKLLTRHIKADDQFKPGDFRRSYDFDHSTGRLPEAYHNAINSDSCLTQREEAKPLTGTRHIKMRRSHDETGKKITVFVVTYNGQSATFNTEHDARIYRDGALEARRLTKATLKEQDRDPSPDEARDAKLKDAEIRSEKRKVALREAMRPCPVTGVTPSFSEVLRRPEFDLTGEPHKRSGATPK